MRNTSYLLFTVVFYGLGMSAAVSLKTWNRTSVQNLVRHKSRGYYARIFANGKETWKSLKTDILEVAKVNLRETSAFIEKAAHADHAEQRESMTMEDCAATFTKRIKDGFGLRGQGRMCRRRFGSHKKSSSASTPDRKTYAAQPA